MLARLKKLEPMEFENLTYDILFLSGVQNLRWRTPSADGGRDLEGEIALVDFSGETVRQRWYIECKRYAKSLNWPTVNEKLTPDRSDGFSPFYSRHVMSCRGADREQIRRAPIVHAGQMQSDC